MHGGARALPGLVAERLRRPLATPLGAAGRDRPHELRVGVAAVDRRLVVRGERVKKPLHDEEVAHGRVLILDPLEVVDRHHAPAGEVLEGLAHRRVRREHAQWVGQGVGTGGKSGENAGLSSDEVIGLKPAQTLASEASSGGDADFPVVGRVGIEPTTSTL